MILQKNRGEKQGILIIILGTRAETHQADGTCISKMKNLVKAEFYWYRPAGEHISWIKLTMNTNNHCLHSPELMCFQKAIQLADRYTGFF